MEEGFAGPHGVLGFAEPGEAVGDEVREFDAGLVRRERPVEAVQGARMVAEGRFDFPQHFAGEGIRRENRRRGDLAGTRLAKGAAVFPIEVPGPAFGLAFGIHQKAGFAPHLAVEKFHAELGTSFGVSVEVRQGA